MSLGADNLFQKIATKQDIVFTMLCLCLSKMTKNRCMDFLLTENCSAKFFQMSNVGHESDEAVLQDAVSTKFVTKVVC